jgi:hypothetical protein
MRQTALTLIVTALLVAAGPGAMAQEAGEYAIDLPAGWSQESYVDGAKIKRVEYIFGDRTRALLKVKRLRAERGQTVEDVAARDVDSTLKFLPGYVLGRTERFAGGTHTGTFVQFDFTRGGRPMLGRHYYLAGSDGTVWALQFTGSRDVLGQLRNATDQMARSFRE